MTEARVFLTHHGRPRGMIPGFARTAQGTGRAYLHRFWPSCQFVAAIQGCTVTLPNPKIPVQSRFSQEQGGTMDELANQWYQAGSLLMQAGFLIAGVWAMRAILRNMRASQEQMGALLKLTVSGGANGEESLRTAARPTPYLLDGWPEAASNPARSIATPQSEGRPRKSSWSGMSAWLQAPMVSPGVSPWRKAVRWLQAPAGS